nr:immunoglobulin heavy chain junction region [Mus musculus]
ATYFCARNPYQRGA